METAGIRAATWVVGKALSPLSDGLVETWAASSTLASNIEALKTELLYAQAMLNNAQGKGIDNPALAELLRKLRGLAYRAEDSLDGLDYFRVQDELEGTFETVDRGCFRNLVCNARHTAKAVGRQLHVSSRSSVVARKKQFHKTPKLDFDRVGVSRTMRHIVEQLQPICAKVSTILNLELLGSATPKLEFMGSRHGIDSYTTTSISTTISESIEPKLYGRCLEEDTIIEHITNGVCCHQDLSVLPIVGPEGIGKTTLTQYIYNTKEVQDHFQIRVWACVSLDFNVYKLTQHILNSILKSEDETDGSKSQSLDQFQKLIEKRLKQKRFLVVLDDIRKCSEEEWERLLVPFRKSQVNGNIILVTTQFFHLAEKVKTDNCEVTRLDGLEPQEFWRFFMACIFGYGKVTRLDGLEPEYMKLVSIGKQIVQKLKGSPLAAKVVGRLLRNNPTLEYWIRVLQSKEWDLQTTDYDIMPALKLSYDCLPFHLQQCFSCCALFPGDYMFSSEELIRFWIGLDILHPDHLSKTIEDIGHNYLNQLVNYGFFKKEMDGQNTYYTIHDLLHELAIKVSSQDCLRTDSSIAILIEMPPSMYHLSISLSPTNSEDETVGESFKKELAKIGSRLIPENLHTLMIFGQYDQSFIVVLNVMLKDAKYLRVLHLSTMSRPVESIIYNFSKLLHLRYLKLKSNFIDQSHLLASLSRFYHLKVLDIQEYSGAPSLPKDMANLSKLRHFLVPPYAFELHSNISNVGKLRCLQELRIFKVKKEGDGFSLKELGELTELGGSLSIFNLEYVQVKEAHEANLLYKRRLHHLALIWSDNRPDKNLDIENQILENLQPHSNLSELRIQHGGSTCPTWLGTNLSVKGLEALCLASANWKMLPPLGELWLIDGSCGEYFGCTTSQYFRNLKRLELIGLANFKKWVAKEICPMWFSVIETLIVEDCSELIELPFSYYTQQPLEGDGEATWFPRLSELQIANCPKLESLPPIPYTQTLCNVQIRDVGTCLKSLYYWSGLYTLKINGNKDLNGLDDKILGFHNLSQLQDLVLNHCPLLVGSYLHMLTSLKKLTLDGSSVVLHLPESKSDYNKWQVPVECLYIFDYPDSGKALSQLLSHLPKLSELHLSSCHKIKRMCIAVEQDEDGMLIFPAHLSNSLQQLDLYFCPSLILDVVRPALPISHEDETGWGLQSLHSLQRLEIWDCPKFLSASKAPVCPFPSSLQCLVIAGPMEGVQTLNFISNLNFLTQLYIRHCGEDLRSEGLWSLLTQGQLSELEVQRTLGFFAGLDPKLRGLQHGQEQQLPPLQCSSKLQELRTDDFAGVLVKPVCMLLSSSLTNLVLGWNGEVERFTKEQDEALQLLISLQDLQFMGCSKLQCLPAGLHRLTSLKRLEIVRCPSIRSLPKGGLPSSLQELYVTYCDNEKLKQRCRKLKGTIPKIILD